MHLDEIEFRVFKNPTSAVLAVMTGQIDYVSAVDPVNVPPMEANPNVRVAIEPTIGFGIININAGLEPLDDKRVRQAFSMSIDREELAKAVYGSIEAKPTVLPVPQDYWPSTPEIQESFGYDPERAKELLAEAGYPDGLTMPFCINDNSGMPQPALKVTDIMIEQMKLAGITLDVTQTASTAACVDLFANQEVMSSFLVTWSGRPDPAITYNQMLATTSYYNTSGVQYGDSDELLAELRATLEQEAQDEIYDRLNEAYLERVPMISLYSFVNVVAYKEGLTGEEILALMVGIPLGIWAGIRRGTALDTGIRTFSGLAYAFPEFWVGMLAMGFFALRLYWFPATGFVPISAGLGPHVNSAVLPVCTLAIGPTAIITRFTRSAMVEALAGNYVRTARALGISPFQVHWRFALKNALIQIVTVIGLVAGGLIGGAVLVERVFAIPGLGDLLTEAVLQKDFPLIQGTTAFLMAVVIVINLCVDITCAAFDPRTRIE